MWNTGYKGFYKRRRKINGVYDGYVEDNTQTGGVGPYIEPVIDYVTCPTTSTTTTTIRRIDVSVTDLAVRGIIFTFNPGNIPVNPGSGTSINIPEGDYTISLSGGDYSDLEFLMSTVYGSLSGLVYQQPAQAVQNASIPPIRTVGVRKTTTTSTTSTTTSTTSTSTSTTSTTTTLAPIYICPSFPNTYNSGTSTVNYTFDIPNDVLNNSGLAKLRAIIYDINNIEIGSQIFNLPNTPDPNHFIGSITNIHTANYVFGIEYLNSSNVVLSKPCDLPVIVDEIINLGSPDKLFYNPHDNLIYYLESDSVAAKPELSSVLGSIGYFNPVTATSINDITYPVTSYGAGSSSGIYSPTVNKIYCQGYNSGGLVIFDCTSKTVTKKIPYGSLNSSQMGSVYLVGDKIYANFTGISGFKVVDTNTDNQLPDYIPSGGSGHTQFFLISTGSLMWVFYTGSLSAVSKVVIYNQNDLTTPLQTINNLDTTPAGNSRYTITEPQIDFNNSKIWYSGIGESHIYSIDINTRAIVDNIAINRNGFSYVGVRALRHEKSQILYFSGAYQNSPFDPGSPVTFRMDTELGQIIQTYNVSFSNFEFSPINNRTYAGSPGRHVYSSPNTGYDSDGKIIVYN